MLFTRRGWDIHAVSRGHAVPGRSTDVPSHRWVSRNPDAPFAASPNATSGPSLSTRGFLHIRPGRIGLVLEDFSNGSRGEQVEPQRL